MSINICSFKTAVYYFPQTNFLYISLLHFSPSRELGVPDTAQLFDLQSNPVICNPKITHGASQLRVRLLKAKLQTLDVTLESLADISLNQAHSTIKSKVWETESQLLLSTINPACSPSYLGLPPSSGRVSNYFRKLINSNKRWAFMLARLKDPSAVLAGRLQSIPLDSRICNLCSLEPDMMVHILSCCPALRALRDLFLGSILPILSKSRDDLLRSLLDDNSMTITNLVADYLFGCYRENASTCPTILNPKLCVKPCCLLFLCYNFF